MIAKKKGREMKITRTIMCVGLIFVLVLATLLVGCRDNNQIGSTVDEPEITVEYLEGDYVKQLLRDGAEHIFGNIIISKDEEESIVLNIEAKEFVKDSGHPNGFYIEDRNYSLSAVLSPEARCTFLSGDVSLPQIMSTEQFVEAYNKDADENKLYDMYIMGDQIELILEKYIP